MMNAIIDTAIEEDEITFDNIDLQTKIWCK